MKRKEPRRAEKKEKINRVKEGRKKRKKRKRRKRRRRKRRRKRSTWARNGKKDISLSNLQRSMMRIVNHALDLEIKGTGAN